MYNIAMRLGGIRCVLSTHAILIHHYATTGLKLLILENQTFTSIKKWSKACIAIACALLLQFHIEEEALCLPTVYSRLPYL